MNKFLASLLTGALLITLGTSAFAADAAKTIEPTKSAEVKSAVASTKATHTKVQKKHHRKHAKKHASVAASQAAAALEGK